MDCFATGTIPVYYGAPDIGDYFNKDGIIDLSEEFDVSEEIYYNKMDAIKDNLERTKKMEILEDFIFKNYFDNKKLTYAIIFFSLNPYLIVSSRNLTTHYHQELILILFFYFLISQKNKLHYFLLGFICTLSFSAYHLLSVFLSTLLFLVFLFKKIKINVISIPA